MNRFARRNRSRPISAPGCFPKRLINCGMAEAFYFHIALEPHHKHSGSKTGRRILFLVEVPVESAKKKAANPEDEDSLCQEARWLAKKLAPLAMRGVSLGKGEDVMEVSSHSLTQPSKAMLQRAPDVERDGVRVWLLGANAE
jgi:hypothetical protein